MRLFAALTLVALAASPTLADTRYVVNSDDLNVRDAPSTSSRVIAQLPRGTPMVADRCNPWWCHVSISGHTGFVSVMYLLEIKKLEIPSAPSSSSAPPLPRERPLERPSSYQYERTERFERPAFSYPEERIPERYEDYPYERRSYERTYERTSQPYDVRPYERERCYFAPTC